jgi:hypothetical protein
MDKLTRVIDIEESLSSEQSPEQPSDAAEQITPLTPECFGLVGGGSGIFLV